MRTLLPQLRGDRPIETPPDAGWYPDPGDPAEQLRWWDGRQWTGHLRTNDTSSAVLSAKPAPDATTATDDRRSLTWVFVAMGILAATVVTIIAVVLLRESQTFEAGDIRAGYATDFVVGQDRTWELSVDLVAGRVVIDVRGDEGFDAVALLMDARTGEEIAFSDDRGFDAAARHGGQPLDPLIEANVAAGRYALIIHGRQGRQGSGSVQFIEVGD